MHAAVVGKKKLHIVLCMHPIVCTGLSAKWWLLSIDMRYAVPLSFMFVNFLEFTVVIDYCLKNLTWNCHSIFLLRQIQSEVLENSYRLSGLLGQC